MRETRSVRFLHSLHGSRKHTSPCRVDHPRRLGPQSAPRAGRRQRREAGEDPVRAHAGARLAHHAHQDQRRGCGSARWPRRTRDGQQRGGTPEPGCRSRGRSGTHAHHARDPQRRIRAQCHAAADLRTCQGERSRRACDGSAQRWSGAQRPAASAGHPGTGACAGCAQRSSVRARLHRRPRHRRRRFAALHPVARGRAAEDGRSHRHRVWPLLRHGSRSPLGTREAGLRPAVRTRRCARGNRFAGGAAQHRQPGGPHAEG